MLTFHTPVALFGGLTLLVVFLVYLRLRFGDVQAVLRERIAFRLVLALVAGWLGAWSYLPSGLFLGSDDALGHYVPGAIFGLLVLVPMLAAPTKQWGVSLFLLWTSIGAHAAMWVTGLLAASVLDAFDWQWGGDRLEMLLIAAPAGAAFGVVVALSLSVALQLRILPFSWVQIIAASAMCGIVYVDSIFGNELLPFIGMLPWRGSGVYVAYAVLFSGVAGVISKARTQPVTIAGRTRAVSIIALAILTMYLAWLMWQIFVPEL